MIQTFVRLAKRFAVLLPGIVIAYFSVRNIFPYFDNHLPIAVAVFLTYMLGAYVLTPALIRLYRIFHTTDHLPLYCVTPDGFASDPLNIAVIATRRELIQAMEKADWYIADSHNNPRNLVRHVLSSIYNWSYPNAPVSSLYLFGRKQDIAFEYSVDGKTGDRHHVRFWATTFEKRRPLSIRSIHWHHRRAHVQGDNLLWVGAASRDIGLGFIRHNLQITHLIDPDTDKERRLIINDLKAQGLVRRIETVVLGKPYQLMNRVFRGHLHTDGKLAVVSLKPMPRPGP